MPLSAAALRRLSILLILAAGAARAAQVTLPERFSATIPEIEVTCASTMVPAVVHMQALGKIPGAASDPNLVKNRYHWNFGDPAGRWNSLTGFNAAHVYDKPGSYTVNTQPGEKSWELIFGRLEKEGQWGVPYQPALELGRAPMSVQTVMPAVDMVTIKIERVGPSNVLGVEWGGVGASAPFRIGS